MTDIEQVLSRVRSKAKGRTRYEGQTPYDDEVMLAEIMRLRQELAEARAKALEDAAVAVGKHDAAGREWSPDSFWGQVTNEAVARIRALDAGKEG